MRIFLYVDQWLDKGRTNQLGNTCSVKTWSILLTSRETILDQKMGKDQRSSKIGQKVRIIEILADAGTNMGLFKNVHAFKEAGLFASYLQTQSSEYIIQFNYSLLMLYVKHVKIMKNNSNEN